MYVGRGPAASGTLSLPTLQDAWEIGRKAESRTSFSLTVAGLPCLASPASANATQGYARTGDADHWPAGSLAFATKTSRVSISVSLLRCALFGLMQKNHWGPDGLLHTMAATYIWWLRHCSPWRNRFFLSLMTL